MYDPEHARLISLGALLRRRPLRLPVPGFTFAAQIRGLGEYFCSTGELGMRRCASAAAAGEFCGDSQQGVIVTPDPGAGSDTRGERGGEAGGSIECGDEFRPGPARRPARPTSRSLLRGGCRPVMVPANRIARLQQLAEQGQQLLQRQQFRAALNCFLEAAELDAQQLPIHIGLAIAADALAATPWSGSTRLKLPGSRRQPAPAAHSFPLGPTAPGCSIEPANTAAAPSPWPLAMSSSRFNSRRSCLPLDSRARRGK